MRSRHADLVPGARDFYLFGEGAAGRDKPSHKG
jgi:hypothetical protein